MKKITLVSILFLSLSIGIASISGAAERRAPEGFGQSYDEIVALAKKEGKVRIGSSDPDEKDAPKFLKPFVDKYGIPVEYTRARGTESRERILLELMAGVADYDLLQVSQEIIGKYKQAGALAGPFDWQALFGIKPVFIGPERYLTATGCSVHVIAYNPDLVPKDRIPRKWEDFLDPWWQGKFILDTRPRTFGALYNAWGKEKLLDFCRALKANKPIFKRGQTAGAAELAAGEYPAFCGIQISVPIKILERDPDARIAISIPTEAPVDLFATFGVLKGAKYPNAALLLAGWLSSEEGQKQYAIIGRDSPLFEDTPMAKRIRESGAKVTISGWEYTLQEAKVVNWIVEAWGFPTAGTEKKKKK